MSGVLQINQGTFKSERIAGSYIHFQSGSSYNISEIEMATKQTYSGRSTKHYNQKVDI